MSTVVAKDIQVRDLSNVLMDFDRVEGPISTTANFSAEGLTGEEPPCDVEWQGINLWTNSCVDH